MHLLQVIMCLKIELTIRFWLSWQDLLGDPRPVCMLRRQRSQAVILHYTSLRPHYLDVQIQTESRNQSASPIPSHCDLETWQKKTEQLVLETYRNDAATVNNMTH